MLNVISNVRLEKEINSACYKVLVLNLQVEGISRRKKVNVVNTERSYVQ